MNTNERANHSRWCVLNPKRTDYVNALENYRKNIINPRNQYTKARDEGRQLPKGAHTGKPGTFLGKKHSEETKLLMKEKALASSHRRLVRSIIEYTKLDGTIVKLDSSWEVALAQRLDSLDINWIRPEPIKWVDTFGVTHNYFPDFYLTEYDIYLDPKNPQAVKVQKYKLDCLTNQINNLLILTDLEDCKNFTP